MKYKDLMKVFKAHGVEPVRIGKGSHRIFKKGPNTAVVPKSSTNNEISPGTLRDIFKSLGIVYK